MTTTTTTLDIPRQQAKEIIIRANEILALYDIQYKDITGSDKLIVVQGIVLYVRDYRFLPLTSLTELKEEHRNEFIRLIVMDFHLRLNRFCTEGSFSDELCALSETFGVKLWNTMIGENFMIETGQDLCNHLLNMPTRLLWVYHSELHRRCA